MKLSKVDFYLDWPSSIDTPNLRKYIMTNLLKKGKVIRWSIIDVQHPIDPYDSKKIRIDAVLAK